LRCFRSFVLSYKVDGEKGPGLLFYYLKMKRKGGIFELSWGVQPASAGLFHLDLGSVRISDCRADATVYTEPTQHR
jgi:hypothetical protein